MGRYRTLPPFNTLFTIQANGCWTWNAATLGSYGSYGEQAHRYAYRTMVGPIPEGYEVDHLCLNTTCVNPHHLQPVTKGMNHLRALWARGYSSQLSGEDRFNTDEIHARALAIAPIFSHIDEQGYIRSRIAERLGITKQVLRHYELGHTRVPPGFIDRISAELRLAGNAIPPDARALVERKTQTTKGA